MARPIKLNQEVETAIVTALASGVSRERAAQYAGIGRRTFDAWMNRGLDDEAKADELVDPDDPAGPSDVPETMFAAFRRRVLKAEASAEVESLARIRRAGQTGIWQADAWFLERRHGYIRREPAWEPDDTKVEA